MRVIESLRLEWQRCVNSVVTEARGVVVGKDVGCDVDEDEEGAVEAGRMSALAVRCAWAR